MEFGFRLADIFPGEISVVGNDLVPVGSPGVAKLGPQVVKERMTEIIESVGRASAAAQNLHQIITSTEKLRQSDGNQLVYFLCDFTSNQVVGLLKVGKKKLFVYDQQGVQHEMNPLCILDFYIHESRQRVGCGRILFDKMLEAEHAHVEHLAIDRPSDKFLFFLRKHYDLTNILPQVNNFVIFDGFFFQRDDYAGKKPRWTGLDQTLTPEKETRQQVANRTQFQDSRLYNAQPALHLRNLQGGLPGYIPQRHASSIGTVVQPPSEAMNGYRHQNQSHSQSNFNF